MSESNQRPLPPAATWFCAHPLLWVSGEQPTSHSTTALPLTAGAAFGAGRFCCRAAIVIGFVCVECTAYGEKMHIAERFKAEQLWHRSSPLIESALNW